MSREFHQPPQVKSSKVWQSIKHGEAWVHMLSLFDSAYHAAQGLPSFYSMVICHTTPDPCPIHILCDSTPDVQKYTWQSPGMQMGARCSLLISPHAAVARVRWWRCRKSLTVKGLSGVILSQAVNGST